jgi:hypothetical protein
MLRSFNAQAVGHGLARAAAPILTKQLFYGAAVSCAVGVGLGLWLEPPRPHLVESGVMQPVAMGDPAPQPVQTTDEAPAAPLPYLASAPREAAQEPAAVPVAAVQEVPPQPAAQVIPAKAAGPPLRLEDAQPAGPYEAPPPERRPDPRWRQDEPRGRDWRAAPDDQYAPRGYDYDEPAPRWSRDEPRDPAPDPGWGPSDDDPD